MEVHAAMSASRIKAISSGRILSARLAFCVLLAAVCLLTFPRKSAQTFSLSGSTQSVGDVTTLKRDMTGERIANLSKRLELTRLPEPNDQATAALSMAAGDFDENGIPDLVVGFASSDSYELTLYSGDADSLYPDTPAARQRQGSRGSHLSTALIPGSSFRMTAAPDFLVAGDFDFDGHLDLATAAKGGDAVDVLTGDGKGKFALAKRIDLGGRVTALGSSNQGESRGISDLAIGVIDKTGPAVVLFRMANPERETIRMSAEVAALTFRASNGNSPELLIAAGRDLLIYANGTSRRARSFSSTIRSMLLGSFLNSHTTDLALLLEEGEIDILGGSSSGTLSGADSEVSVLGAWPGSTQLARARISGGNTDDLIAIDRNAHRLQLLIDNTTSSESVSVGPGSRASLSIDVEGEPFAALPMRLTESALTDMVVLRANQSAPAAVHVTLAMTFLVDNTGDSGPGSLRQAITNANNNAGADTINFAIPGPAPHTINLLTALPAITESVTINGTSQPDFAGTPVVELNGVGAGFADGLTLNGPSNLVKGLVINRFIGNGIVIASNGNTIEGNFIGTNAAGTFALSNTLDGIFMATGSINTIGGTTPAMRNLISGNRNGIQMNGAGTGNQVRGNFIGTNVSGTSSIGNSANGLLLAGPSNTVVGAPGSASSNTIAFNGAAGVAVTAGIGNSILSNSIFGQGGLGIDLGPTGVTPNDPGDVDGGPNTLQNFPVLTSAVSAGTSTTVQGTLNSTPGTIFRLEFFSDQVPNASGFGEGRTFIGSINVTTDASGDASFNQTFPVTVFPGQVVTATATNPGNSTSEFSKALQIGGVSGGTPADLAVLASVSPALVNAGSQLTKNIIVSNAGPAVATNVTVTDVFSSNVSTVSCSSTGGGVCGGSGNNQTITFASLPVGASAVITIVANVSCSVPNGTVVGNTATVFSASTPDINPLNNVSTANAIVSNPPPIITCPAGITQFNDLNQCSAIVNFVVPSASGVCPANVACSPPSGSAFPIGVTTVNCVATGAGVTASCSFTVTINDFQPIQLQCPPNVSVTTVTSCTPVVNFSQPTVIDNCPGARVICVPPSGSSFPIGNTNVTCTATDAKGVTATCGFTVTVIGLPQALVRLEGGGSTLDFGPINASRKFRKLKKQPVRNFTVENVGCGDLVLTFLSLVRTGPDVDGGFITDPDDRALFNLTIVDNQGNERPFELLTDVRIPPGGKQLFKIRFNPLIPAVQNRTSGLAAADVLPERIESLLTFLQNGGTPLTIRLVGHIDTAVQLIDPVNPRVFPFIGFSRDENDFVIEFSIFDANLDTTKVTYQFFNKKLAPVEPPITVALASLVNSSHFVEGQSFTIIQRISGAKDHPEIAGVQVTVSDGETSSTAISDVFPSVNIKALSLRDFPGVTLVAPKRSLPSRKE